MAESTELMTVGNIFNRVYIIRGQQVMLYKSFAVDRNTNGRNNDGK